MDEKIFFADSSVNHFMKKLNNHLQNIPHDIRKQHIDEIKADLYNRALSLSKKEDSEDGIPQKVMADFVSPHELASGIQHEYEHEFDHHYRANQTLMKYFPVFSTACLGALSLPIIMGFMNLSSSLPLLIFFCISNLWMIGSKRILWNEPMLEYIRKMITFSKTVLVALPFAFFSIRLIMVQGIEAFSAYYLLLFLTVVFLYGIGLSQFYKKKHAIIKADV